MDTEQKKTRRQLREEREKRAKVKFAALPFFAFFFALSAVSFIIPLRPTQSVREKRTLTEFPAFSVQTLLNGDYFDGITLWFSDTFPFRENLLDVSSAVSGLHGYGSIVINYDIASTIPKSSAPEDAVPAPAETVKEPAPILDAAPKTDSTEEVPLDTAAVEEASPEFINDGNAEIAFGQNIQIDDNAYGLFVFSEANSDAHIERVNSFAALAAENGINFYDMLIPSGLIRVSDQFSAQLGCSSVSEAFSYIYSHESDDVIKLDIFDAIAAHNSEYIFFHSDHHWTALGAYYAYEQYCEAAGIEAIDLSAFDMLDMGEYRGSYYYNVPQPNKLAKDDLVAYKPISELSMVIHDNEKTYSYPVLEDSTNADPTRKYYSFLGGDIPLGVITNNSVPEGTSCMIIKDSFGSPLSIFLAEHYHTLYVMDYRVYSTNANGTALKFAQEHGVKDIILAQSIELIQNDKNPIYLKDILR